MHALLSVIARVVHRCFTVFITTRRPRATRSFLVTVHKRGTVATFDARELLATEQSAGVASVALGSVSAATAGAYGDNHRVVPFVLLSAHFRTVAV